MYTCGNGGRISSVRTGMPIKNFPIPVTFQISSPYPTASSLSTSFAPPLHYQAANKAKTATEMDVDVVTNVANGVHLDDEDRVYCADDQVGLIITALTYISTGNFL